MSFRWVLLVLLATLATSQYAHTQATQKRIIASGELHCGLITEEPEYSNLDAHGNRAAFDVDLCKAVAVSLLGPTARFTMTPYPDELASLQALKGSKIDLLSTATPSLTNRADYAFARPIFLDHQGLMVNRASNIKTPQELTGKKVCFLVETAIEANLQAYMQRQQIKFIPFPFQEEGEMEAAFITGNCAAISADVSQLAYERIAFHNMARNFEILPDVVAKDPLSTATRHEDFLWTVLVSTVEDALVQAEESGVTQANLNDMKKSADPDIQHLLGTTGGIGKPFSLDDAWAARVLHAIGNYEEMFERDLGNKSPMRLDRAENRINSKWGLLYALPLK